MARPTPDFAGFEEAQVTLRAKFGREVQFFAPSKPTWPANTPLNPETGRPFDPTIRPLASAVSSAAVVCGIVQRPIPGRRLEDQRISNALGQMSEGSIVAIVGSGDVGLASGAATATYLGHSYKVTDFIRDALGPVERYLAFLERR